jgi:hypothetical protein
MAGSDFSIFVLVQNLFDVPVTIHEVQTHIPVELIDVNQRRLRATRHGSRQGDSRKVLVGPLPRPPEDPC